MKDSRHLHGGYWASMLTTIMIIASAVLFAEFSPKGHVSWQEALAKPMMPQERGTWDHKSEPQCSRSDRKETSRSWWCVL